MNDELISLRHKVWFSPCDDIYYEIREPFIDKVRWQVSDRVVNKMRSEIYTPVSDLMWNNVRREVDRHNSSLKINT